MTNALTSPPLTDSAPIRFVGRQPILDRNLQLYGHELLFRSGTVNAFSGDPEIATKCVIDDSLLLIPADDEQLTFINCTRESLQVSIKESRQ